MRLRPLLPSMLFVLAGVAGWALIWNMPAKRASTTSDEPEPEPALTAPPITLSKPSAPTPTPEPEPAPAATPTAATPAWSGLDLDTAPPPVPTPAQVLRLPERLENASEANKRAHFTSMLRNTRSVLGFARQSLEQALREPDSPETRKRAEHMRAYIEHSEAQLEILEGHMASLPELEH